MADPITHRDHFVTTRWTQVLAANGDGPVARDALSELCGAYYTPVVGFLRRQGRDEDAARELAHSFFATILEGRPFSGADPRKGRFRSYLLGALKHFVSSQHAAEQTARRGGQIQHDSIDAGDDHGAAAIPVASPEFSDAAFDRDWALSVLDRAMSRLKQEWEERGALEQFHLLKPWLTGPGESQELLAQSLGLNEGAARVTLHRFRRRFGDLVKAEIAQTVHGPTEAADEMRHLIAALS